MVTTGGFVGLIFWLLRVKINQLGDVVETSYRKLPECTVY